MPRHAPPLRPQPLASALLQFSDRVALEKVLNGVLPVLDLTGSTSLTRDTLRLSAR